MEGKLRLGILYSLVSVAVIGGTILISQKHFLLGFFFMVFFGALAVILGD